MHGLPPLLSILLLSAGLTSSPAQAAEDYDNCTGFIDSLPAVVGAQGTWCLRKDLSTSMTSGRAIEVAANNVILDCNRFKLGGLGAGPGTGATGVFAENRRNLTVRNCNIRGFRVGISSSQGGGHLIEYNGLDGNTLRGIWINSPDSTIRRNRVIDTGGSTALPDADVHAIYVDNGIDVLDNTISGVAAGNDASAYGIFLAQMHSNEPAVVAGNRIRGLAPAGGGAAYGIYVFNSIRTSVHDNLLQGSAVPGSIGVRCGNNLGTARDNLISGFGSGVANCTASGNIVNPN